MSEEAERIIRFLKDRSPAERDNILGRLADLAHNEEIQKRSAAEQKAAREARIKELANTVNTLAPEVERTYKGGDFKKALEISRQYSEAAEELQDLQNN